MHLTEVGTELGEPRLCNSARLNDNFFGLAGFCKVGNENLLQVCRAFQVKVLHRRGNALHIQLGKVRRDAGRVVGEEAGERGPLCVDVRQ